LWRTDASRVKPCEAMVEKKKKGMESEGNFGKGLYLKEKKRRRISPVDTPLKPKQERQNWAGETNEVRRKKRKGRE